MVLFDSALRLATIAVVIIAHGSVADSTDDKTVAASISFGADDYSLPVLHVPSAADSSPATIPNRTLENAPELIRFEMGDGKNMVENQNVELNAEVTRSNISKPEMLEFVTEDGKNSVQINQDYDIILNRTKLMMAIKAKGKSFPPTDEDFMLHDIDVYKFKPSNGSIFGDPKDWTFNMAGKPYVGLDRNATAVETETALSDDRRSHSLLSAKKEKPISFTLLNTNKGFIETENKTSNLSDTAQVTDKTNGNLSLNKTVFKGPKNYQTNFRPQFRPSQTINFITNGNRDILKPYYPGAVNSYGEPTAPYGIPPPPAVGFDKINAGVSSLEDVAIQDEGVASVKNTKSILKDLVEKLVRLDLNSTGSLSATHSLDIDGKLLHTAVALSYGRPYRHKITEVPASSLLSAEDAQDYVTENEKIKKGGEKATVSPATTTATIGDDDDDLVQNDESSDSQDDEYSITTDKTTTTTKPKLKPKPKPTPTPQPQTPTTLPPPSSRQPKPNTYKPNRQNNKMAVKPMKTASPEVNNNNNNDDDEYSIADAAPIKTKSQEIDNESDLDASEPEENYPIVEPIRIKKGTTTTTARPSTEGHEDEDDDVEDDDAGNYGNSGPKKPLKPSSGSTNNDGGDDGSDDDYYENKLVNTKNKHQDSSSDQDAAFSSRDPVKKKPSTPFAPAFNKLAPLQDPVDSSEEIDYYENVPTKTSPRPDRTSSASAGERDRSRPNNAKRPDFLKRPASDEYSSGFKPARPIQSPPTDNDSVFSDEDSSSSQKHRPYIKGSYEDFYKPVTPRPPPDSSGSDEDFYKPVTTTRKPKPTSSGSDEDEDFYKPITTTRRPKPDSSGSDEDFYKPVTTTRRPKPTSSGSNEDEDFYKPVTTTRRPNPDSSGSEEDEDFYKPVKPMKRPPPDSGDKDFFKPVTPINRPPPTKATPYTRFPIYPTYKPFRPSRPNPHESGATSSSSEANGSSEEMTTTQPSSTTPTPTAATTTVVSTTKKDSGSGESYEFSGESGSREYYSSEDDYYYSDEYSGSYDDRDFSHSGSDEYGSDEYRRSKSRDITNGTADAVSSDGEKKLISGMRMVRRFRNGKGGMRRKRRRQGRKQKLARRSKDGRIGDGMRLPVKGVKRSPDAVHHLADRRNIKLNGSLDDLAKISVLRF